MTMRNGVSFTPNDIIIVGVQRPRSINQIGRAFERVMPEVRGIGLARDVGFSAGDKDTFSNWIFLIVTNKSSLK